MFILGDDNLSAIKVKDACVQTDCVEVKVNEIELQKGEVKNF